MKKKKILLLYYVLAFVLILLILNVITNKMNKKVYVEYYNQACRSYTEYQESEDNELNKISSESQINLCGGVSIPAVVPVHRNKRHQFLIPLESLTKKFVLRYVLHNVSALMEKKIKMENVDEIFNF